MPQGFEDIDDGDDIFHDPADGDTEAEEQVNGELKDKAGQDEEEKEDPEEEEAPVASKDAGDDSEEQAKNAAKGEDDVSKDDDDDEEEGAEYSVEAIRDHKFYKGEVYYWIKWQGYGEADNTWEPEEHLLPHARQLLAAYHEKIGGPPVPPVKKTKSKQNLRGQASSEDLPPRKRRKRNNGNVSEESVGDSPSEETVGTWLPSREDWESLVVKVETVERDDAGQLLAYIKFKNGKRSKVGMDMVYRHCPRPMLRFYEEHLRFK